MKKWALVTGASRGIGAGIATHLSSLGYHVVINYASNREAAEAVQNKILASGGSAEIAPFHVGDSSAVDSAIEGLVKAHGGAPELLVNNAGISIDGLLLRLKDEDLRKTLNVDLEGAIFCTRAVARFMMRARKGSIIQISSVIGEMGNAGQAAYAAAKAGLIGFSKSVAKELASRNIRVNVVTPGFIRTEMTEALTDTQKEEILRAIPLSDWGSAEDIAQTVAFLASDGGRYITGQVIGVNGGLYI